MKKITLMFEKSRKLIKTLVSNVIHEAFRGLDISGISLT